MSEILETAPKALVDLKLRDCRWVCEEPIETNNFQWMYCGARSKSESCSYCADHHKIMFNPPSRNNAAKRLRMAQARRV